MNKIFWIILILIIVLIGAGFLLSNSYKANTLYSTNNTTNNSTYTNPPNPNPAPSQTLDSGIDGIVTISPTCPTNATSVSACLNRPYATTFNLYTVATNGTTGTMVKSFSSDQTGHFKVAVAPGTYQIQRQVIQANPSSFPKMTSSSSVTVIAHTYTHFNITFDSGVR